MRVDGSIGYLTLVKQIKEQRNGVLIKTNGWPELQEQSNDAFIKADSWSELQEQLTADQEAIAIYKTFDEGSRHIQGYMKELDEELFNRLKNHLDPQVFIYGFYALSKIEA